MSQKRMTVRQALQFAADYPTPVDDELVTMHTGELIARTLFDIANKPDVQQPGSMTRANKARKMIFDRLSGRRRAGTSPARPVKHRVVLRDLTVVEEVTDGEQ